MKSHLLAALLVSAAPALAQQSISTLAPPVVTDPWIAALRDNALDNDHYAWDLVEGLTTEVGQRLAATEAEARARDWAVARLKSLGFANVHVEPFDMPVWTRGAESAEIVSPFPQKLAVAALGYSGSTGADGVTGSIAYFDSLDALRAAPDSAVRGKIVFIDHHMVPTQDGAGYGQFGAPRRQGPTIASLKGAIGIVVRSIGTDHHRNPHTGVQYFTDGARPIPAGALAVPDAEQLVRILKRGRPVVMRLTLVSEKRDGGHSGNVVAEVPGRDPSRADPLARRPSRQLGPRHRRDRRRRRGRDHDRGGEAHHGRRPPAAHDPRGVVRGRGTGRIWRRSLCQSAQPAALRHRRRKRLRGGQYLALRHEAVDHRSAPPTAD